jgi:hypothetical protein
LEIAVSSEAKRDGRLNKSVNGMGDKLTKIDTRWK